ncbi:hypothetical protein TNCV_1993911 [Trichonephila clavipes]|nr:hypothetical protein TNCV_1993911 [Trichonephila clavipes]
MATLFQPNPRSEIDRKVHEPVRFTNNEELYQDFIEQLALMATNTSHDVGRSGLGHIAIWTERVNFKTRNKPVSSSTSIAKPSKNRVSSRLLPVPSKAAPVSFIPLMYGGLVPRRTDILFGLNEGIMPHYF